MSHFCISGFQILDANILNYRTTRDYYNQKYVLSIVCQIVGFLLDLYEFLKDDWIYNLHNRGILNSVLPEELHAIHFSNNSGGGEIDHQVKYQVIDSRIVVFPALSIFQNCRENCFFVSIS